MTAVGISPLLFPELHDTIFVAGVQSPGLATVTGAAREHDWDVKRGPGTRGAKETYRGDPPSEFKVKIELWTQEHFDAWEAYRPLFQYDPTKKTGKAIDIFHPVLFELEIGSVVVKSFGQREVEGPGRWSYTIGLLEYYPAKKKNATSSPEQSTTNGSTGAAGTPAPSAQDAQQQEIANLLVEAQKP